MKILSASIAAYLVCEFGFTVLPSVLPWQAAFIADAFGDEISVATLSVPDVDHLDSQYVKLAVLGGDTPTITYQASASDEQILDVPIDGSSCKLAANWFELLMNEPAGERERVLWRDDAARLVRTAKFRIGSNADVDLSYAYRNQAEDATGTWGSPYNSWQITSSGETGANRNGGGVVGVLPGNAPGYLFADGNARSVIGFKISPVGTDIPNLSLNFNDGVSTTDDNLEDWENLVLLFRLESPDGSNRFYGAVPLGADDPAGDPYQIRGSTLNNYLGLAPAGTKYSSWWSADQDGWQNVLHHSINWLNANTPKFINADGTGNPVYSSVVATDATDEQNAAARVKVVLQLVRAEILDSPTRRGLFGMVCTSDCPRQ